MRCCAKKISNCILLSFLFLCLSCTEHKNDAVVLQSSVKDGVFSNELLDISMKLPSAWIVSDSNFQHVGSQDVSSNSDLRLLSVYDPSEANNSILLDILPMSVALEKYNQQTYAMYIKQYFDEMIHNYKYSSNIYDTVVNGVEYSVVKMIFVVNGSDAIVQNHYLHYCDDYVVSLTTSYRDVPANSEIRNSLATFRMPCLSY